MLTLNALQSYRWIFLTVLDVTSEIGMVGFIAYTLRDIQFRETRQRWKLGAIIILGRCWSGVFQAFRQSIQSANVFNSTIPLAISFCVVMLRSSGNPYLGPPILDALERQQGLLFASLFTSTLVPVFKLFNITKVEVVDSSVELNITKTVEVRMEHNKQKHKVDSSAASLSVSTQGDTRELLDPEDYRYRPWKE